MENKFVDLLHELESFLRKSHYSIINKFDDGKQDVEIYEFLKKLNFQARKDFVELYSWRNGIKGLFQGAAINQLELFANGIMLPLEYAISLYLLEVKVQNKFKKYFLPIFTNGGGDYILMNFDSKSKSYGQLFLYSPSLLMTEDPMSIYDSLETLFETILFIYKENGYVFKSEVLEVNYEIENKISRQLNIRSEFWKNE